MPFDFQPKIFLLEGSLHDNSPGLSIIKGESTIPTDNSVELAWSQRPLIIYITAEHISSYCKAIRVPAQDLPSQGFFARQFTRLEENH
eukprot:scaffold20359_cov59-Cylindrotheca_fusiformis.AAC.1